MASPCQVEDGPRDVRIVWHVCNKLLCVFVRTNSSDNHIGLMLRQTFHVIIAAQWAHGSSLACYFFSKANKEIIFQAKQYSHKRKLRVDYMNTCVSFYAIQVVCVRVFIDYCWCWTPTYDVVIVTFLVLVMNVLVCSFESTKSSRCKLYGTYQTYITLPSKLLLYDTVFLQTFWCTETSFSRLDVCVMLHICLVQHNTCISVIGLHSLFNSISDQYDGQVMGDWNGFLDMEVCLSIYENKQC